MAELKLNDANRNLVSAMMRDSLYLRLEAICEELATAGIEYNATGYVTVQVTPAIVEVARRTMREMSGDL